MKDAIIALLKVKSLISLAITGLVCYLGAVGLLPADKVFELALIIVGFYFGTQHEKKNIDAPEVFQIEEPEIISAVGAEGDE